MCQCTPNIRTPFCGKPGCEWPEQRSKDELLTEARTFIVEQQTGYSLVQQLVDSVEHLTAERDQYKRMAEINAQTVVRQANELRRLAGSKSQQKRYQEQQS